MGGEAGSKRAGNGLRAYSCEGGSCGVVSLCAVAGCPLRSLGGQSTPHRGTCYRKGAGSRWWDCYLGLSTVPLSKALLRVAIC